MRGALGGRHAVDATDRATPNLGTGFYYLVRGTRSNGTPRIPTVCPERFFSETHPHTVSVRETGIAKRGAKSLRVPRVVFGTVVAP
jgi:hypothetical protein